MAGKYRYRIKRLNFFYYVRLSVYIDIFHFQTRYRCFLEINILQIKSYLIFFSFFLRFIVSNSLDFYVFYECVIVVILFEN